MKRFATRKEAEEFVGGVLSVDEPTENRINVYTDGSASNGSAGVGVYFADDHPANVAEPLDRRGPQTNQRAELRAIGRALEALRDRAFFDGTTPAAIHTDSRYAIHCLTDWMRKWIGNDFNGNTVTNRDLIEETHAILAETQRTRSVSLLHVFGHRGQRGNEEADRLANRGRRIACSTEDERCFVCREAPC